MLKQFNQSFWSKLRVSQKLALIPLLFVSALGCILYFIVINAQDQKQDVFIVNMTARQRMLVNRQLAQALLVSQGIEIFQNRSAEMSDERLRNCVRNADYPATRQLAIDTADAILNGGSVLVLTDGSYRSVPGVRDAELRAKLTEHRAALANLSTVVDDFLKAKSNDPTYRQKLDELLEATNATAVTARVANMMFSNNLETRMAEMIRWCTVIGLIVTVLGIVISWLITRGIVQPLSGVLSGAQRIAQGDLSTQRLEVASNDEIGSLAQGFNEMLDGLKNLTGQTAAVTENLNAAAAQILASTQQQATGTKEQAATIQQINATMEEVRQAGAKITERAKQVSDAAEAGATTALQGLNVIQESNSTMEAIRRQVEEVAENIVALSEKTQAISEIIVTVNDIAERSNLLALNAAIEAADAGEQGNRFSVVANEIKSLADQAKESTVQVRTILVDIQKRINSSVLLTEEAVKRTDSGKRQTDLSEQMIRRLADAAQESVQAFQQIIGATGQQQIGFEQVTQGMQDIGQAASQNAAGTMQLEKAVAGLNAQSHLLREAVFRYRI